MYFIATTPNIGVAEIMQEAAKAGIRSSETAEEYRKGLELLR